MRIDLRERYTQEIAAWEWDALCIDALENCEPDPESPGVEIGRSFLGTVMSVLPSGKYYMPWCTNQTWRDEIKDSLFMEILEQVADGHDMWLESGEGDPCDLFVCVTK